MLSCWRAAPAGLTKATASARLKPAAHASAHSLPPTQVAGALGVRLDMTEMTGSPEVSLQLDALRNPACQPEYHLRVQTGAVAGCKQRGCMQMGIMPTKGRGWGEGCTPANHRLLSHVIHTAGQPAGSLASNKPAVSRANICCSPT